MNKLVVKRLNGELNDNYEVIDEKPVIIDYVYKYANLRINLGDRYPFAPPRSIGNWSHEKYRSIPQYVAQYTGSNQCVYCSAIEGWDPSFTIHKMISRFIKIDTMISNCVKLNLIQRNTNLSDNICSIIFSYFE